MGTKLLNLRAMGVLHMCQNQRRRITKEWVVASTCACIAVIRETIMESVAFSWFKATSTLWRRAAGKGVLIMEKTAGSSMALHHMCSS